MKLSLTLSSSEYTKWAKAIWALSKKRTIPLDWARRIPGARNPRSVTATGLQFLLEVGIACGRPESRFDPTNLFGLLKYALVMAPPPGLLLAATARRMDTHKKRLLSDEFGCGAALLVARRSLAVLHAMDVEQAIHQGLVRTASPSSMRPDYLLLLPSGDFAVLEAKGSQSGMSYVQTKQLVRGCQQVQSVQLPPGSHGSIRARVATGIAIQFAGDTDKTRIAVDDPSGEEPFTYTFEGDPREAILRQHYRRVAIACGDRAVSVDVSDDESHLVRREIGGMAVVGSVVELSDGPRTSTVFLGLEQALRNHLAEQPESRWEAFRQYTERAAARGPLPDASGQGEYFERGDGVFLVIEVEE